MYAYVRWLNVKQINYLAEHSQCLYVYLNTCTRLNINLLGDCIKKLALYKHVHCVFVLSLVFRAALKVNLYSIDYTVLEDTVFSSLS